MRKSKLMKNVSILIKKEDLEILTHTLYDLQLIEFFETKLQNLEQLDKSSINKEIQELVLLRSAITRIKPYFTRLEGSISKDPINVIFETLKEKQKLEQKIIQAKDSKLREKVRKNLHLSSRNIDTGFIGYIDESRESAISSFKARQKLVRIYKFKERVYFYSPVKPNFKYKEYFIPSEVLQRESVKELKKELDFINQKLNKLAN